jgi:hypothetical protein
MDAFEYKGRWWFPQFPDHVVDGIIKFDPVKGGSLETIGETFQGEMVNLFAVQDKDVPFMRHIPQNIIIDAIWGYTERGDAVTLHSCNRTYENISRGYTGANYSVEVIFIGCHFLRSEEIIFNQISIHYSDLEKWLGISGFSGGFNRSTQGKLIGGQINYEQPDRFEVRVNNITIAFDHTLQLAGDSFVDHHTKQFSFIEITPDEPMHYNDYHSTVIYYLRNFFCLGMGTAVLPLAVSGKTTSYSLEEEIEEEEKTTEQEKPSRNVSIFYVARGANLVKKKPIERWYMPFGYSDISDKLELYLCNWFNLAEKIIVVFDLYFSNFYMQSTYINLELLSLAQALETYQREMYGGTYMAPKDYEHIREILVNAIPDEIANDHRESLKNKIKYGNSYALRKRIERICDTVLKAYEPTVKKLVGDYKLFSKRLAATRNYLTHYSEDAKDNAEIGATKQYRLLQKMKLLLQLCFLKEIGISPELVDKLMAQSEQFKQWADRPFD